MLNALSFWLDPKERKNQDAGILTHSQARAWKRDRLNKRESQKIIVLINNPPSYKK